MNEAENEITYFYTAEQVAERWNVRKTTILAWTRQPVNPLKFHKIGKKIVRFTYKDLMDFLKSLDAA